MHREAELEHTLRGDRGAGPAGPVDAAASQAWSDPLAPGGTRSRSRRRPASRGDELANDLETGARLLDTGAVPAGAALRRRDQGGDRRRCATPTARSPSASAPRCPRSSWPVLDRRPDPRVDHHLRPAGRLGRPPAGRVRLLVRVLPAILRRPGGRGRADRFGTAPSPRPPSSSTAVAAMGFDIVYLPPIHPIGEVNRKGRNNSVRRGPATSGRRGPSARPPGGHDAVHPELGTLDDFDAFVAAAGTSGLEVALDLALQCAPDHPWVTRAPGMVHRRCRTALSRTRRTRPRTTRTSTR